MMVAIICSISFCFNLFLHFVLPFFLKQVHIWYVTSHMTIGVVLNNQSHAARLNPS